MTKREKLIVAENKEQSKSKRVEPRFSKRSILVTVIGVLTAAALTFFEFDILAHFHDHTQEEMFLEVQAAFALATILIAGLGFTIYRRMKSQRNELVRRLDAETKAREALELALLDPLTGLANRRHFEAIFRATAGKTPTDRHALILLDLDDFKLINDTYGHPTGDKVLQIFSERIRRTMQAEDLVARLGGDEFAIVAFNVTDSVRADAITARLKRAIQEPIALGETSINVTASVGYTLFPEGEHEASEVIASADQALYAAKAIKNDGKPAPEKR